MNFIPKQHLEIGNYIKYIDEILHKCDKGIEYCKICPNEFVCAELEKDDFGLNDSTTTDILTAIQYALNKVPGYLSSNKRNDLKAHIKRYINESPIQGRKVWEDCILDILLDDKLANPSYKPRMKTGEARTLLTYGSKISFSSCLRCLCTENEAGIPNITTALLNEVTSNSITVVNQFIKSRHIDITIPRTPTRIKYHFEECKPETIQRCNLKDTGLAAALCYYAVLTKTIIPETVAVTGGLDGQGRSLQADFLDDKIEMVLRELHFIDTIVITKGASFSISAPDTIKIIGVGNLEQAIDMVLRKK